VIIFITRKEAGISGKEAAMAGTVKIYGKQG
jgi:hypothetical protein